MCIRDRCKRPQGRPYSSELQLSSLEVTKALTKIFVCSIDKNFNTINITDIKITRLANISNMALKVQYTVKQFSNKNEP